MKHYPAPHPDDPDRIKRIEELVRNKDAALDKAYLDRVKKDVAKKNQTTAGKSR